mmetsp:Transcript_26120/g.104503  ORF Transcript_26120/g.104503 Transcript_26120/m.104503 type:complete len:189 (-) Transcript_26120:698-1264(-)
MEMCLRLQTYQRYPVYIYNCGVQANPTIGASFLQKRLLLPDDQGRSNITIALQLWDTAGQERFRSMAPMYYRGATAAIIVFDAKKDGAWDNVKTWYQDLLSFAEPGVVIGVAANKTDLPHPATFDVNACKAKCVEWGASLHFTSAVTGEGVDQLFLSVAKQAAGRALTRQDVVALAQAPLASKTVGCC